MPTLSYAEVTTIVLAALTIVLGCLALFVGGLAIWGYQSIKSEGIAAAEKSAERATQEALKDAISRQFNEQTISKVISAQFNRMVRDEVTEQSLRYSRAFDSSNVQGPSTERVGKEYPEGDATDKG